MDLAIQPVFLVQQHRAVGRLEVAMTNWSMPATDLNIVSPLRWASSGPRRYGVQARDGQGVRHAVAYYNFQGKSVARDSVYSALAEPSDGAPFIESLLLPRWVTASGVPANSGQSTTDERVAARSA